MSLIQTLRSHETLTRLAVIAGVGSFLQAVSADRLLVDPLAGLGKLLAIAAAFLLVSAVASYLLSPDSRAWQRRLTISAGLVLLRTAVMVALLPAGDQYVVRYVWLVVDAAMCVALPAVWLGAQPATIARLAALGAGMGLIFPWERWVFISTCIYALVLDQHGWTPRHLLGFALGVAGTFAIAWASRNGWLYDQLGYVFSAALFCFVYAWAFIDVQPAATSPAAASKKVRSRTA
jgi:hypothetical protein